MHVRPVTRRGAVCFRNLLFRVALVAAVAAVPTSPSAQTSDAVSEDSSVQSASSDTSRVSVGAAESVSPGSTHPDGLYFRAGILFDRPKETRFLDPDCGSTSPDALYGCGEGPGGMPRSSVGDFGTTSGFEIGLGYPVEPALRLEALLQFHPGISFAGRANFLEPSRRQDVSADLSTLSGLLVAYVDLSEAGLPRLGPLQPFVGAGGGLSRIEIDDTRMEFPKTRTIVPGGRRTNLAWMMTAGVAVPVGKRAMLDFAWRYSDYGTVETGRAKGRVVWRDGNRLPLELDLAETRAELRGHGLAVSLRYPF